MVEVCRSYLKLWLQLLDAGQPGLSAAARAAQHIANCPSCQARLRQLVQAVEAVQEDQLSCADAEAPLLAYIETQATGKVDKKYQQIQTHLALCPSCLATYADIAERRAATLADQISIAANYPTFDLSFLGQRAQRVKKDNQSAVPPLLPPISALLAGVRIRVAQLLAAHQQVAVAARSRAPEKPLWTLLHEAADDGGWEAELTAYDEGESGCRLEVAVYRAGAGERDLINIPVTLRYDGIERTEKTVAGGKVFFANIPREQLPMAEFSLPPLP